MTEWGMDRWKYFDIIHRFHVVCNPTSLAKVEEIIGLLRLKPGSSVLDIACGKAEMLVRLAKLMTSEAWALTCLPTSSRTPRS